MLILWGEVLMTATCFREPFHTSSAPAVVYLIQPLCEVHLKHSESHPPNTGAGLGLHQPTYAQATVTVEAGTCSTELQPLPIHLVWQGALPITLLPHEFSQADTCCPVKAMGLGVGIRPCILCMWGLLVCDSLSCEFRGCLPRHQCALEPVCPLL